MVAHGLIAAVSRSDVGGEVVMSAPSQYTRHILDDERHKDAIRLHPLPGGRVSSIPSRW